MRRSDHRCPGCGTPEGAYHEAYCDVVPIAVTPCCQRAIFNKVLTEHEPDCPAGWGSNGLSIADWQYPSHAACGDPWRGLKWS